MRAFACRYCRQLVFFENTECLHCGAELGFRWARREVVARRGDAAPFIKCANAGLARCNWLVEQEGERCFSCSLTRTRPADEDAAGLAALAEAEAAKRWLLFELGELGLPIVSWQEEEGGLAFDLLSSAAGQAVSTGHDEGVITLDLAESDDAHRERMRAELDEPYRTVLGHLRHEIGHYYWPILIAGEEPLERYRELFGDESEDYAEALERHYEEGPPPDWAKRFVSAYATMHPWEDWAETFAHYLHIWDTLQTSAAYGVWVRGPDVAGPARRIEDLSTAPRPDHRDLEGLIGDWLPLTYALNALNRSMGRDDLYPFVLPEAVIEKLGLVHERVLRG